MAEASSIQQSSLPWQLRQAGKNLSEWIQLRLSQWEAEDTGPPPNFEFPAWLGQFLFWLLVIGVVGWLAWLIVQLLDNYLGERSDRPASPKVDFIPPPEQHTVAAWLRRAQQFEREGNWREACRALYMAALQLLHDREWIPHQPSRTDGEYLRAVQTLQRPRPLQMLIRTHERSLFGGEPLAADNVQRCRQAYEEIAQR
ncbi:DUF4129 domain-containing protein [Leptolyngbya iicbica]|uniref:DUF4129 domain-containing protein n=2 Tax=Cyanophyceae TaxID=3028117 RepID=A0A4Q7EFU9_9CYAN|nr:DUF4129 domain-containing protein [Leptolyngbya sp. LK]RZM82133.1 DUF4129 domain-containing protein [Leptolyngbya sp. LK]